MGKTEMKSGFITVVNFEFVVVLRNSEDSELQITVSAEVASEDGITFIEILSLADSSGTQIDAESITTDSLTKFSERAAELASEEFYEVGWHRNYSPLNAE